MCGLVFAISARPVRSFVLVAHARQHYRGPDGEGVLFEETGGVHMGMAHERLAIVGLSESGAQPMLSASGRFRILFNGEVYNFRELARQFGLHDLKSGTDTEVIVELVERLGIDEAVAHFNGMWAMVIHDIAANRFYVSRDRFGKKPLYVHRDSGGVFMASEMHSLLGLPGVDLTPDAVTASRFLAQSLQNVDDRSWLASIKAFPPASIGEIDGTDPTAGVSNIRTFWKSGYETPLRAQSPDDCIEELRSLVQDAVRLRLHADVPVGVALSGGIDSSIIAVQATQTTGAQGQRTELFSAVNPGSKDDESVHIDAMARHLDGDVRRVRLDPEEGDGLFGLLQTCIRHADGPVTSFSSLLFYKLMESARSAGITVVLTGQGADEAFCGYRKYPILEIKRLLRARRVGEATKLAAGFIANGTILPQFNLNDAKRYTGASNKSILGEAAASALDLQPLGRITSLGERQWLDVSKYSVPYLCHYEDRMSMAWSREVRSPFLDYRVVDMGLRMPERLKLSRGWTKYALRKAFECDLPPSIAWRKDKKGFANPQDDWLKGNLQPVVRDLMGRNDARVYQTGLVDKAGYLERFDAYCAGRGHVWFRDVFAPFALELWMGTAAEIEQDLKKQMQCHVTA
ncbi:MULTISPECIES: asparagine synthase (glutamine-hydrolyzing) [Roseobacteraceae]|uniref:asparagine synthase (glutamine-hydrolyzing) n=3 Tax=Roseobacteraceae TaxID=2854170 RepID=A0A0U1NPD9_9RHOB|nr:MULTISPECIES: asparagine synthase (glutamine-hydrolyzing) [Roseobacteraceae]CRK76333.1 Asparagine synthetase [glutamine-hydrolyzing] 1 [Nereida ignava]CUH61448.1 Asparagine synthetase [glutamine-hydrolyzing] 1 [Thalassobacter stenotrophicus]SFJ79740.1 asparagine synthase (glutamine-hydrolysing) [Nereida ignava DSM 16309]SHJ09575.1 asparagine synthase (glutamine-hydrolysing) [Thalassobacter stenotrophicus DSM 16310]